MRRICLCCFFSFLVSHFLHAQLEAANWYFGQKAGITFNSGGPRALLDGELVSVEGCASISDSDGNLLFYTEGTTVWNQNHEIMPNGEGVRGSTSSSQTALIVPNPSDSDIYYLFTTDDALLSTRGRFNGFSYSTIDMSLDNGNGDIIEKNKTLLPIGSEKISGVLNFRGGFYWVVTHYQDRFYAYKVDENGVDPNPTISLVGPSITSFVNGRGSLKIAPNATKLAMSYLITHPQYDANLFVFDFDANTGLISNPVEAIDHTRAYYGLEFSSNSKKLYASGVSFNSNNTLQDVEVIQFNLEAPDFFSDETVLISFPTYGNIFVAGSLQMGLDKRIYHSFPDTGLSVIKSPNADGVFARASINGVRLGGRQASFGLPSFVQSFFETIFEIDNFCLGDTTTFVPEDSSEITSISWDFGDPNSGTANTSNALKGAHVFSGPGSYTVTISVTYSNSVVRDFVELIQIDEPPNVLSNIDLVQCDIDGVDDGITSFDLSESIAIFGNGNDLINATFFTSESEAILGETPILSDRYSNTRANERVYARVVEDSDCFSVVEINLVAEPMTNLGLYDTLFICDGIVVEESSTANLSNVVQQLSQIFGSSTIGLYETEEDALYEDHLLPESDFSFATTARPELYFRVENNNRCAFIGSVELVILEKPSYKELMTVYLCNGSLEIAPLEGYETYLWSTGYVGKNIMVNEPGMYDVAFSTGTCTYIQTFEVLPTPKIEIDKIAINDFARNNSITIIANSAENLNYSIDGGLNFQDSNDFLNLIPGIYSVVVDNGCTKLEEEVVVGGVKQFFTPNEDNSNDRWALANPEFFPGAELSIYDRYGKLLKVLRGNDIGWDGTFRDRQMPSDNYWYQLKLNDGRIFKGFFALKR